MQATKDFLDTCYALGMRGLLPQSRSDRRVARGFADLGYEEFLLLNNKRLISLYTGTVSELPEAHQPFFFPVPTTEDLIDKILSQGWKISSSNFVTQRYWHITLEHQEHGTRESQHKEFDTALAKALLETAG